MWNKWNKPKLNATKTNFVQVEFCSLSFWYGFCCCFFKCSLLYSSMYHAFDMIFSNNNNINNNNKLECYRQLSSGEIY